MSKWLNDEKEIEGRTGLQIGKVEINGKIFEKNICLYECKSDNFHLLPELSLDGAETALKCYIKVVREVQTEIYKRISIKYNLKKGKGNGQGNLSKDIYPLDYTNHGIDNKFYKYIRVWVGQRNYTINFMRWYIDKDKKVNCRFGEIQFDTTIDIDGRVNIKKDNEKTKINYPNAYINQSEKMIRLNEDQVCIYNPTDVGNIWKIQKEEAYDNVVEKFENFIKK